ncbi:MULTISPECIES: lytic polysaccharide monooxygenase [unclassified Streptomyces]|uniref:lytic polysaccharide monooxygenase auxiliary activity family 9 protein n=1 Tax=unclassified Streptomyces TaxID=2593676 RepID=UPI0033B18D43
MTAYRTATAAAVALAAPLLLTTWAAGTASAHGAPTSPVSRVYACSPEGGSQNRTAACLAAIAANGSPFTAWDNLRVGGVDGRDRSVIPDGKLCSGGLPAYKGLDLARADFPATRLTPGARLNMKYSSTIAHTGTFKLYLTNQGYSPTRPLKWSDLPEKPFATVTDPALVAGAYRIGATLPSDRTGRQMLFTIWQNSSTTDTYYSCSDVVFSGGGGASKPAASTGSSTTAGSGSGAKSAKKSPAATRPASATPSATAASPSAGSASPEAGSAAEKAGTDHLAPAAESTSGGGPALPMVAGGAGAALLLTAGVAVVLRRRR